MHFDVLTNEFITFCDYSLYHVILNYQKSKDKIILSENQK